MKREHFEKAQIVDELIDKTEQNIRTLTSYEVHPSFILAHLRSSLNFDSDDCGFTRDEFDKLFNDAVKGFIDVLKTKAQEAKEKHKQTFDTI